VTSDCNSVTAHRPCLFVLNTLVTGLAGTSCSALQRSTLNVAIGYSKVTPSCSRHTCHRFIWDKAACAQFSCLHANPVPTTPSLVAQPCHRFIWDKVASCAQYSPRSRHTHANPVPTTPSLCCTIGQGGLLCSVSCHSHRHVFQSVFYNHPWPYINS
jgi:hypothetical protein